MVRNSRNNKDEKTNISTHPEQFTLYRLADYDDQLGTYSVQTAPKQIITGIQVQEEETKKFTVKELIAMLKLELQTDNVINIAEQKEG